MKKLFLLCIVLLFLSSVTVWADLILTETDNPGDGSGPQTATMYLAPGKLAVMQGTTGIIYRSDRKIVWVYDTQHKVYMEFTPESMRALKAKTDAMVAKEIDTLKKQMQSMPKDQKAAMQKAIDQMQQGDTYSFKKAGPAKVINGFRCTPITVLKNGEESAQLCATSRTKLGMSESETQLLDSFDMFNPSSGSGSSAGAFGFPGLDKFLGYKSFPVWETDSSSGNTETITLTSVQRGSSPAGTFDLPHGFTKQSMF